MTRLGQRCWLPAQNSAGCHAAAIEYPKTWPTGVFIPGFKVDVCLKDHTRPLSRIFSHKCWGFLSVEFYVIPESTLSEIDQEISHFSLLMYSFTGFFTFLLGTFGSYFRSDSSHCALFFVCFCEAFAETGRRKATLKIKAYGFRTTEIGKWSQGLVSHLIVLHSLFLFCFSFNGFQADSSYFNKITIDCYF